MNKVNIHVHHVDDQFGYLVQIESQKRIDVQLVMPKVNAHLQEKQLTNGNFCYALRWITSKLETVCLKMDDQEYCVSKEKLNRQVKVLPFLYRFDHVEQRFGDGWLVPILADDYQLELVDGSGQPVSCTLQMVNRLDLVRQGYGMEEHSQIGFHIVIENGHGPYSLKVIYHGQSYLIPFKKSVHMKEKLQSIRRILMNIFSAFTIKNIQKGIRYLKKYGIKRLVKRLYLGDDANGLNYPIWFANHRVTQENLMKQRQHHFAYEPKISIIVPVYRTPLPFLKDMIESVLNQSYSNWELCIADGSCYDAQVQHVIREYMKHEERIRYIVMDENQGISGNTNAALALASGEYIGLLDHDDFLELDALYEVVQKLNEEKYDLLYTDEDKVDYAGKIFNDPNFKPDYSPDLMYSHNYITHFFVAKSEIVREIGGFHSEYDGAQDYDFMLRCIEKSQHIGHIAKILYHWRLHEASTAQNPRSKMYAYTAGQKALLAHFKRVGIYADVEILQEPFWGMYRTIYHTPEQPLVSIVIPNKDHIDLLDQCIKSVFKGTYQNFEIVIIENNSTQQETFAYYKKIQQEYPNVNVMMYDGTFNYSKINNYGVQFTHGEYILFLNNDTKMISPNAIEQMLGNCMRSDVGIVGAKLLYEDQTIQHAGVIIGLGGFAGHAFVEENDDEIGYMARNLINCNYSAVTAACMMVKKRAFEVVNGFDEQFVVALNDIDLCLRIRQLGYYVVYHAYAKWYHYESKSRGHEDTFEKQQRFQKEISLFQQRYAELLKNGDPFYNPNFDLSLGLFKLN